jgi:uncharacterized protein YkwD
MARLVLSSIILVTGVVIPLSLLNIAPSVAAPAQPSRYFQPTGYTVGGSFLSFFEAHGGVTIFGYPISERVTEGGRPVQYFERQRFEYHGEAAGTPNVVQLGRLGAELAPARAVSRYSAPFASTAARMFFPQTRHSLSGAFLAYWRANGSVRVLGYPVTEPLTENGLLVQYFERARMEYHPEKASAGYAVELGALGRQFVNAHPDVAARLGAAPRSASPDSRGSQPPSQPRMDSALALSGQESELLGRINDARKGVGAGLVSLDRTLKRIALSRSQDMVARNYFSHTTPDGSDFLAMLRAAGVQFKFAGEIIANNNYEEQATAYVAYNSFMDSPRHREIMLDRRYSLAGVGEATNSAGYHFFTVIFVQR